MSSLDFVSLWFISALPQETAGDWRDAPSRHSG
jgi:hypothetical protein